MLKKIILIVFVLNCSFIKGQTDTSAVKLVTPTIKDTLAKSEKETTSEPPALGDVFKPKISLGVGMLSFHGDLYASHYQAPWTARVGYDLNISQRLSRSFQINFNVLFGKLGANEWLDNRQQNFQSEIRSGGISILYDFGNFIPDKYRIRPWISAGVNSFEFLSKTDMYDKNGNKYFYWSDGSIKNIDEHAANASTAINLVRDYTYETDIRELNKDGFGKYQERAWAFPVGFGAIMKITDRFDLKMGMQYYFTTTDYIDGITNNSLGTRSGTKQKDNFVYTSFALQYDLVFKKKGKMDTLPEGYFDGVDWLAIDNGDYDEDGIKDWDDKCHGTPKGVKVNEFGCPFDDDKDGVPNYSDEELETPEGMAVNMKGVSLNDEYWQNWYNQYMDSGNVINQQVIENYYALQRDSINNAALATSTSTNTNQTTTNNDKKVFTIELARYTGPVPNEEMAFLLSIGDIQSTILEDGSTVLYTAGTYKEIQNAVKRRDEFIKAGSKNTHIGYYGKDGKLSILSEEEIAKLMEGKNVIDNEDDTNEFAKGDIVYRVQLGAYKNRISKGLFKNVGKILELKGDEGLYHYMTKGFKTIQSAANTRADLVVDGYGDAFITAYKDGKRIALNKTNATMQTTEKENLTEIKSFSSIDKSLITFKIQLGALRKVGTNDMEDKIKDLKDLDRQSTGSGMIRYTAGSFTDYSKADKYREELANKGFTEAFVIAVFKGEVISIQEALELLK
jgi:hypothetical protein